MKMLTFYIAFFHVLTQRVFFKLLKFRKSLFFSYFTKNIYTFAQNTKKYKYEQHE